MLRIDTQINPWIDQFNIEEDKKILNNLLNLGYNVSKLASISNNNDYILEFIKMNSDTISNSTNLKLQNLETTLINIQENSNNMINTQNQKFFEIIERISGKFYTSSNKGKIAENFLYNTLCELYPNDSVEMTTSTAHESDIQLKSNDYPTMLIESKFYSNPVPTKEIEKFKSDMDRTNIKYGIFISFGTTITGKNKFQIENYNDKLILYLPNADFEISLISLAVISLRKISTYDNNNSIDFDLITQKADEILEILKSLDTLYENITKMKYELLKNKKNIIDNLDNIHSTYLENEVLIKNIITQIKSRIENRLNSILNIASDTDNKYINFENIQSLNDSKNKLDNILYIVLTKILSSDFNLVFKNDNYYIYKLEKCIAEIVPKKTIIKFNIINCDIQIGINNSNIINIDKYISLL